MPGNVVLINNSLGLEWYVGDSKMPLLIKYLDSIGVKVAKKKKKKRKPAYGK